jgi:recombination protein RecR
MLPQALENAIGALGMLPGVGPRTAERYAYYLFKSNSKVAENIADALANLHDGVKSCPITFALIDADEDVSPFYTDPERDKTTILVVEEPLDIYAIEQIHGYKGTYHVLGGAVSPIDGITPDQLHIKELIERVEKDKVKEVIIATNPSVEGESTALLIEKMLHEKNPELKLTRLARGLPLGVDLSYADQITLNAALENRTQL